MIVITCNKADRRLCHSARGAGPLCEKNHRHDISAGVCLAASRSIVIGPIDLILGPPAAGLPRPIMSEIPPR